MEEKVLSQVRSPSYSEDASTTSHHEDSLSCQGSCEALTHPPPGFEDSSYRELQKNINDNNSLLDGKPFWHDETEACTGATCTTSEPLPQGLGIIYTETDQIHDSDLCQRSLISQPVWWTIPAFQTSPDVDPVKRSRFSEKFHQPDHSTPEDFSTNKANNSIRLRSSPVWQWNAFPFVSSQADEGDSDSGPSDSSSSLRQASDTTSLSTTETGSASETYRGKVYDEERGQVPRLPKGHWPYSLLTKQFAGERNRQSIELQRPKDIVHPVVRTASCPNLSRTKTVIKGVLKNNTETANSNNTPQTRSSGSLHRPRTTATLAIAPLTTAPHEQRRGAAHIPSLPRTSRHWVWDSTVLDVVCWVLVFLCTLVFVSILAWVIYMEYESAKAGAR